ncbi:hypothetical protein [Streptomyces noursei]|uniref:CurL C-terminal domain-containing protein n=1 Tax=Streptomyces noursei TaxID=1971 RepID=UPI003B5A4BF8
MQRHPDLAPADIALSLATQRSRFTHRAVVLSADHDEATRPRRPRGDEPNPPPSPARHTRPPRGVVLGPGFAAVGDGA